MAPTARVLRRHALEIVAVLCLLGLVLAVNPSALAGVFRRTNIGLLLLMLPVTIGTYLARSLGWWVTLRAVKIDVDIPHSIDRSDDRQRRPRRRRGRWPATPSP